MLILITVFAYPFLNLLAISLNDAKDAASGGIYLFPREFSLDNYKAVFNNDQLLNGFIISVSRTVIGTVVSVLATSMLAYGLSKQELMGRKAYNIICMVTMFFSGGLIPYAVWINTLGLTDSFLVYIIPSMINVWNMIIMRTYFKSFPKEIEEAAKMDGCSNFGIFFRFVIPLSMPVIATVTLFNAVGQWNSWFDAYIFINKQELVPLQTILMKIISQNSATIEMSKLMGNKLTSVMSVTPESIKIATIMVATIPIISIYPFVQKYFVQGILIGSVKE